MSAANKGILDGDSILLLPVTPLWISQTRERRETDGVWGESGGGWGRREHSC